MKPTEEDVKIAIELLNRNLSTKFINILFREEIPNSDQIASLFEEELSKEDKLRFLINCKESKLFAGKGCNNNERIWELKIKLLDNLDRNVIDEIFDRRKKSQGKSKTNRVRKLAETRWRSGDKWPMEFVRVLGFPKVFAGVKKEGKFPEIEDVEPVIRLPKLVDFQEQLKDRLLEVLNKEDDKTRCIISLPTGGGKTRTAVEAFIDWLQPKFSKGQYLIWIAQSEELCNQAVECIKQLWASREFTDSLRIYRYFGSTHIETDDLIGGVVVSSIHQLHSRAKKDEDVITEIVSKTGAIIIDEAHRATSEMYRHFFEFCKRYNSPDLFPICGLTATPGRSMGNTYKLVEVFESQLFTPDLGSEYNDDPLEYFRKHGYLARPKHEEISTNITVKSDEEETEEQFKDRIEKKVLSDLEKNTDRNKLILKRLLKIPKGKKTIVYACTVAHADMLSTLLNCKGRPTTSISASTPKHYRRKLLEQFKAGDIEFVVNYGVLTTGFDAPKTEYIVICRPTFSDILYEQIVGRGLRGTKFGGTSHCTIIDFSDNFERFGDQQAYRRYRKEWKME